MANQAIVVSITADSKGVDAELQKTKSKFQDLNKNIISDESTKSIGKIKSALRGLSGVTDGIGGAFGKIAGGLSAITSPIGLATAGITLLFTSISKIISKTQAERQKYIQRLKQENAESDKNIEKLNKESETTKNYFKRLQQLNSEENKSNSIKSQTALIIKLLTEQYGNLGLQIDKTTGKIIGLDNALSVINSRIGERIERQFQSKIQNTQKILYELHKGASFLTADEQMQKKMGTSGYKELHERRFKQYNNPTYEDFDQRTQKELKFLELRRRQIKQKKDLTVLDQQQLKYIANKMNNLSVIGILKSKQKIAKQIESKADGHIRNVWREIKIAIQNAIIQAEKYRQLLYEDVNFGNKGRLNEAKKTSEQIIKLRQKQQESINAKTTFKHQAALEEEQYQFGRKQKKDKYQYYQDRGNDYIAYGMDVGEEAEKSIQDIMKNQKEREEWKKKKKSGNYTKQDIPKIEISEIGSQRAQRYLQTIKLIQNAEKQKKENKPISVDIDKLKRSKQIQETDTKKLNVVRDAIIDLASEGEASTQDLQKLAQIEKQLALRDKQKAKANELDAKYEKQYRHTLLQRDKIIDQLNDYFKLGNESLQAQIKMQEAVLDGESEQIEKLKIINALRAKGYKISDIEAIDKEKLKQIDELAKKQAEFNKKTYLQQSTKAVDDQIKLLNLKLQGKLDELQIEKKILAAKQKEIQLTEEEAKKQVEKDKELNRLKFKQSFKEEAEDYLRANNPNRKQAEKERRIKEYEDKYGKLDEDQKRKVEQLVDYQFQLEAVKNENKVDLSKFDVKTNDLTAKGGFVGGAVSFGKDQVNTQLKQNSAKQISILQKIAQLITEIGMT